MPDSDFPEIKPPHTAEIVNFRAYRNRALIESLEEALAEARAGTIDGAIMVFRRQLRNHGVIVTGTYEKDPEKVCAIAGEIFIHFHKQCARPTVID
jgi:hypothetical protein